MITEIKRDIFNKLFFPGLWDSAQRNSLTFRQYIVSITDEEEIINIPYVGQFRLID